MPAFHLGLPPLYAGCAATIIPNGLRTAPTPPQTPLQYPLCTHLGTFDIFARRHASRFSPVISLGGTTPSSGRDNGRLYSFSRSPLGNPRDCLSFRCQASSFAVFFCFGFFGFAPFGLPRFLQQTWKRLPVGKPRPVHPFLSGLLSTF